MTPLGELLGELLRNLAQGSNGRYYFLESSSQIPEIFAKELAGVRTVTVRNTRLVLRLEPGVSIRHAHRIQPRLTDLGEPAPVNREVTVPMGDLHQGETLSVLFELSLHDARRACTAWPPPASRARASRAQALTRSRCASPTTELRRPSRAPRSTRAWTP